MTKLPSFVIGIAMAVALLALLALTRLLVPHAKIVDLEVREIEIATLPEPPPPPPEEPPPDAPPPPPALTDISNIPDPARVPVPKVDVPIDLTMPVDPFFTDLEPAPLPERTVSKAPPSPVVTKKSVRTPKVKAPQTKAPKVVKRPPPPAKKSHYGVGELDGKPRLLRHGSAGFPSSLARKGVSSGTVVLEVELSTGGRVKIRRVVSSSHPELVSAARKVASTAKFTPPTKNGQRVKALMRWPIKIKK